MVTSTNCRMCESNNLELFLDLGPIPLVDRFLSPQEVNDSDPSYPLNLKICMDCGLVHLGEIVPAEKLFNENYAYESGTTKKRRESYLELANFVCKNFMESGALLHPQFQPNPDKLLQ